MVVMPQAKRIRHSSIGPEIIAFIERRRAK